MDLWHSFPCRDTDVSYRWQMDGDDNFLIIRSFVITYQIIICKVMLLGRNSFPETELIQLQLLCFLGFFPLILQNEFCALQYAASEKHNFSLQRYKTGSIMLG